MRNDIISRQAAIDAIEAIPDSNWTSKRYSNEIRKLPSAQPDIVYCKDCISWRQDRKECMDWYDSPYTPGDGYCHRAERKEE